MHSTMAIQPRNGKKRSRSYNWADMGVGLGAVGRDMSIPMSKDVEIHHNISQNPPVASMF